MKRPSVPSWGAFWASVFILACNAVMQGTAPTAAATPSATSEPSRAPTTRPTFTRTPTFTPRPTATKIIPTATLTPAAKGEIVSNGRIEVVALDMFRHDKIVPGGMYWYRPKPGYLVIDLFVKVKNLTGKTLTIPWSDALLLIGAKTETPDFAGFQPAKGNQKVAPLSFGYDELYEGSAFTFDDTVYLQIIYVISDSEHITALFRLQNAPLIQINVK